MPSSHCSKQLTLDGGSIPLGHLWIETTDNDGCYKRFCARCNFVSWIRRDGKDIKKIFKL